MKRKLTALLCAVFLMGTFGFGQVRDKWLRKPFTEILELNKQLLLKELASGPTHVSGWGMLYVLSSDGELYYEDDEGNATAISAAGADGYTVKIDAAATAGYLGAAYNDGVLRTDANELTYTDGGSSISLGLANHTTARSALGLGATDEPQFAQLGIGNAYTARVGVRYSTTVTFADNGDYHGIQSTPQYAKTAAAYEGVASAFHGFLNIDSTNSQNWSSGGAAKIFYSQFQTEPSSTGTIDGVTGFSAHATFGDNATVTDYIGVFIGTPGVTNNKLTNGYGLKIDDQDEAQTLNYAIYTGTGLVHFGGNVDTSGSATVGSIIGPAAALDINTSVIQDVNFWDTIASGNPSINIYGWNTAGGDRESAELTMDDANDEFLIQVPNSANNEGVTVSLLETNQRFRVRQNSDQVQIYHDATDAHIHTTDGQVILSTDEAAANAMIGLTESDGTHVVYVSAPTLAADWTLTLPATVGATAGGVFNDAAGDGIAAWSTTLISQTGGAEVVGTQVAIGTGARIDFNDGTDESFIRTVVEPGLANHYLGIGLDETNRILAIGDAGDIGTTDFGISARTDPAIIMVKAAGSKGIMMSGDRIANYGESTQSYIDMGASVVAINTKRYGYFNVTAGNTTNSYTWAFGSAAGGMSKDDTQSFVYITAVVNKATDDDGDAPYQALQIRVTETDIDTAADNYLIDAGLTATSWAVGRLGEQVYVPSAAQAITGVGGVVLANATTVVINPDGDYTLTSTPHIADGRTGQILIITAANAEANTVTFQNQADLGGSNMNLGAASRAVSGTNVLMLIFDGTDWNEISFADN